MEAAAASLQPQGAGALAAVARRELCNPGAVAPSLGWP